jgi:transposase-like protein
MSMTHLRTAYYEARAHADDWLDAVRQRIESGESLTAIARDLGITRERLRQLTQRHSPSEAT